MGKLVLGADLVLVVGSDDRCPRLGLLPGSSAVSAIDMAFPPDECVHEVGSTIHGPNLYAEGTRAAELAGEGVPIPIYGSAEAAAYYLSQAM
jgi:hypothetical protein